MLAEWDLNDTARAQHLTTQIQHLLNMIYIVICQVYYQNQAEDGTMNARSGRWWHDILARGYRAFIEALLAGGPGHTILSIKEHPQHNFQFASDTAWHQVPGYTAVRSTVSLRIGTAVRIIY